MYIFNSLRDISLRAMQSKRELLQELKQQAEASALIKERKKKNEMPADKLLLERIKSRSRTRRNAEATTGQVRFNILNKE